jgi:hypothetical protein
MGGREEGAMEKNWEEKERRGREKKEMKRGGKGRKKNKTKWKEKQRREEEGKKNSWIFLVKYILWKNKKINWNFFGELQLPIFLLYL